MKARKTLVLLGLVAMGHEAGAAAQLSNEQRFALADVDISLGLGLLSGQAREKVYDADNGKKISQLNWDMQHVPTLHLGLAYQPREWLSLDLSGWTLMGKGDGHMKDYDWADDGNADWSDYSDHPDTRVDKAWQAEFAATAWALKRDNAALGVMLGYQRSQYGWQGRGGRYTYSSDDGYRDVSGEFPAGQKGITYKQTYDTPYVGLVGLYQLRDWTFESRFKYSQWVKARDHDQHHLTELTYTRDGGKPGRMQSLALAVSYRINPEFSLKAGVDHQVYAESKGSTRVRSERTGESGYFPGKSAGQSARTTLASLAVSYHF